MVFRKHFLKILTGGCVAFLFLGLYPRTVETVEATETDVLEIPAITQNTLEVPSIQEKSLTVSKAEILKFSGNIKYKNQKDTYSYTAPRDGNYRFELADINTTSKTIEMTIDVCNPDGDTIVYSFCKNGEGVTCELEKDVTYTVYVQQSTNLGTYTLLVGQQKKTEDVTKYTKVKDSIEFTDQKNEYKLTASRDGNYRFELADINTTSKTIEMTIDVCDPDGDSVAYSFCKNGEGVTCKLEKDVTYTVYVQQSANFGAYTLLVGQQKKAEDVTKYTKVKDSIEFTDQKNEYKLTASRDGNYRFELADINTTSKTIEMTIDVCDPDGDSVAYSFCKNGEGVTCKLEKDVTYTVYVQQSANFGTYTLLAGQQKKAEDVTKYTKVKDSIEFTDQKNEYKITAPRDGKYRFELAEIKTTSKTIEMIIDVCDPDGGSISYSYCKNGEGVTCELTKSITYTVYIQQSSELSTYTLLIGKPGSPIVTPTPTKKPTATPTPASKPKSKWVQQNSNWYYYDKNGNKVTGWYKVGSWYLFNKQGVMLTGWQQVGGTWYYLGGDGAMRTGWLQLHGTWYYLDSSGAMKSGWQQIGGVWYYFKKDGSMAANEYCGGYWLSSNGAWTYHAKASWYRNSKGWYYQDSTGWYAKNCTIKIDGKDYKFNSAGYCTNP